MKKLLCFALILFAALSISGCGKKAEEGKVLAKINDTVITLDDFNKKIDNLPKQYQDIIKAQKKTFLDDLVREELLYQEALESNMDKDPETQQLLLEAKRKILVSRLINDRINNKVSFTEEELKKYYDDHSEEFMLPERWRASHILVDTIENAQIAKDKIGQGAIFEDVAKEMSKDATAKQGGDVGFFAKGQLIPEFEEATFKLKVGEVSDIVKSKFGYHIIKLTDKKSPEMQEFSIVKDLIKKELERERKQQMFDDIINGLKKNAKITNNEKLLEEPAAKAAEPSKPEGTNQ